jgi:PRC-barrel domain
MTRNIDDPARLNGTTVIGGDGEKLGSVDAVYYDNATDKAEWVAVRGGLFGTRVSLVPLRRADFAGDELHVPFDKVQVKNAPHHDPGRDLSAAEEADLYRYYGVDYGSNEARTGHAADPSAVTDEMAVGRLRAREHVLTEHAEVDETDPGLRDRRSI